MENETPVYFEHVFYAGGDRPERRACTCPGCSQRTTPYYDHTIDYRDGGWSIEVSRCPRCEYPSTRTVPGQLREIKRATATACPANDREPYKRLVEHN